VGSALQSTCRYSAPHRDSGTRLQNTFYGYSANFSRCSTINSFKLGPYTTYPGVYVVTCHQFQFPIIGIHSCVGFASTCPRGPNLLPPLSNASCRCVANDGRPDPLQLSCSSRYTYGRLEIFCHFTYVHSTPSVPGIIVRGECRVHFHSPAYSLQ